jgi:hypothetical protein
MNSTSLCYRKGGYVRFNRAPVFLAEIPQSYCCHSFYAAHNTIQHPRSQVREVDASIGKHDTEEVHGRVGRGTVSPADTEASGTEGISGVWGETEERAGDHDPATQLVQPQTLAAR